MLQWLLPSNTISGTTGGQPRDGGILSDEKTLYDLGCLQYGTDITMKLSVDTNPIIIRVNLNHSLHQPKPSGSGAGYH